MSNSGPGSTESVGMLIVEGFAVKRDGDVYVATAEYPISEHMAEFGCRAEIRTKSPVDLGAEMLGERMYAGLVAAAERAAALRLAPDEVPLSKTLLGLDEPGTADGG